MRGMRELGRQRIAVAVVLAATLSGGGVAVADDAGTERAELGRIAYLDGELSLDGADDADARVITIDDSDLADAPAPGWDTTAISKGAVAGEKVRWSLSGVDGPGALRVYAEADRDGGAEALLFDSADGLPDAYELPVGETGATRWAFTAEGTYQVIFTAEATTPDGRPLFSGTAYTVLVGDEAITQAARAAEAAGTGTGEAPVDEAEATGDEAVPGGGDGGAGSVAGRARPLTAAARAAATATPSAASSAASSTASSAAAASDVVSTRKVLDEGHIDFAARVVDGTLRIHIKDGTVPGRTIWREPSSVVLHVRPAAENTLPAGDEFAFLGKGGTPVWLLDQVQQEGLLWPGWSTDNITAGATEGGVKFSLSRVEGPGTYALYTYDAMSGANVLFNSKDGVPDSFDVAANTHAHGGWAFTKEGTYRLTLTMSGTLADGTAVSDTETVTFVVGDQDPGAVKPDDGSGGGSASGAGGGTPDSGPGAGAVSGDDRPTSDDGGSMASTGAGNPALLGGTAAALAALGTGAVVITRRRSRAAGRNPA